MGSCLRWSTTAIKCIRCSSIFFYLLLNAIQAIDKKGHIEVGLERENVAGAVGQGSRFVVILPLGRPIAEAVPNLLPFKPQAYRHLLAPSYVYPSG
jgi:hypothetical protein